MKKIKGTLSKSYLILTFFAFSCATSSYISGKDFDINKINRIEEGATSKNEIIDLFGQPQSKSVMPSMEIWTYQYYEGTSKATSYIFTMDISTQSNYKVLTITFDSDNVVQNIQYSISDTINVNVN